MSGQGQVFASALSDRSGACCAADTVGYFRGDETSWALGWRLLSSAEIKNAWSYTSTLPCVSMPCLLLKLWCSFVFYLLLNEFVYTLLRKHSTVCCFTFVALICYVNWVPLNIQGLRMTLKKPPSTWTKLGLRTVGPWSQRTMESKYEYGKSVFENVVHLRHSVREL